MVRVRRAADGHAREAARRLVAARLGRLRGLPQKIGQIVSLLELGGEASPFAPLGEAAPPVPAREAFRWIADELGAPVESIFRALDERGAAASLGQVHRGVLADGRDVAVKVQFPDVRSALDADLAAIGWLAAPLSAKRSGFDLREYQRELRASLLRELDYGLEVQALRSAAARRREIPGLLTPDPVEAWCTSRVLTMTWIAGDRIEAVADWPEPDRQAAATILLRFFLRGCFTWGSLHADPHPGNVRFVRSGADVQVGVLDFGCTRELGARERQALYQLCANGTALGEVELLEAYRVLGFNPDLLAPIEGRLREVTRILCEPFHTDGPFDVRSWSISARLADTLGDDRWNFRFAGPAALIFFIRAVQGLITYLTSLGARLDWRRELLSLPVSARPSASEPGSLVSSSGVRMPDTALRLRIRVVRGGTPVAQLAFGTGAVGHLADLVPEDMIDRIRARGLSLDAIAAETVARGCPPGELFTLAEDDLTVRVWIE